MRPLLEIFTTSWNEPATVERFIKWYRERVPMCDITVHDNMSTDGNETRFVCDINKVKFRQFDTGGKMDESALISLRNNAWKRSNAMFIIVCDSDELIDITEQDLLDCNDGEKWNLCKCQGVELFGADDDKPDEFWGIESEGYCKSVLFHAPSVLDMNFAPGSHTCQPTMRDVVQPKWSEIHYPLYHTKWQNWDTGLARQHEIRDRGIAEDSKHKGWNFHYGLPDAAHEEYFQNGFKNRRRFL